MTYQIDQIIDLYDEGEYDTICTYTNSNISDLISNMFGQKTNSWTEPEKEIIKIIRDAINSNTHTDTHIRILSILVQNDMWTILNANQNIISKINNSDLSEDLVRLARQIASDHKTNFLKILVEYGMDPAAQFSEEIVRLAINSNNLDMISYVLDSGSNDIQSMISDEINMRRGKVNIKTICLLVDSGINLAPHMKKLHTYAICTRQKDLAIFCLENGVDIIDKDYVRELMDICCMRFDTDIVTHLLEIGADINYVSMLSIEDCLIMDGSEECGQTTTAYEFIEFLILNGLDLDTKLDHLMFLSIAHYNLDLLKYCITLGADPNALNDLALFMAANCGHADILKLLLESGADINASDNSIISFVAGNEKNVADFDSKIDELSIYCPYRISSKSEDFCETLKLLFGYGALINDPDILIRLCGKIDALMDEEIVGHLVGHININICANIKITTFYNKIIKVSTALEACAIFPEKINLAKLLLAYGADYSLNNYRAIELASEHKNDSLVKILTELDGL